MQKAIEIGRYSFIGSMKTGSDRKFDKEEIVMTSSRRNNCAMIRLERKHQSEIDHEYIHFIGGGPYKGILVNKVAPDLENVEPPEGRLEFMAYLSDQEKDNESVQDYWTLRFWFLGQADGVTKKRAFTDYFQELMNQDDFPKNYIGFVKRALILLKKYSLIKRVELFVEKTEKPTDKESLPPIKSFITVMTPDRYSYLLVPEVPVTNKTFLTFQIKAAKDAYIALSAVYSDLGWKTHEIVLGEDNRRSLIREGSLGPIRAEAMTMNILSEKDFQYFWISWAKHHLEVGTGTQLGVGRFLHWHVPPNKQFNVNCLAVSTGKTSTGRWEFVELLDHKVIDFNKVARKMRLRNSLIWLAKKQKMLQCLEDAYPNSIATKDILATCKVKQSDIVMAAVMLKDLQNRKLIREVDEGIWMRIPAGQKNNKNSIKMVEEIPHIPQSQQPSVAIITNLYCEKLAVDAMIEEKFTFMKYRLDGESQVYTLGQIGKHKVVSTKLSKAGLHQQSMIAAENTVTRILGIFSAVEHVILVGVGGAVPHYSDFNKHVRLGDVVVSTPVDKSGALYVHCQNVEKIPGAYGYSYVTRAWSSQSKKLQDAVQELKREVEQNVLSTSFPWDQYIEEGKELLESEESDFHRPLITRDKLFGTKPDGTVVEYKHPTPSRFAVRGYIDGQVTIRYGTIGSGKLVTHTQDMKKEFSHLNGIKAFDSEFEAVLNSLEGNGNKSFLIIRGMADYCDGTQKKGWQPYAALVASAYAKSLLCILD